MRPETRRLHRLVDSDYYLTIYPDVAEAKIDAARHYLEAGWREGRNPSPNFNTIWYLQTYRDAAASGINPLLHFLRCPEQRRAVPDEAGPSDWIGEAARNTALPQAARAFAAGYDLVRRSKLFNTEFYRVRYPYAPGDPIEHFIRYGWRIGCDPGPGFSTARYLQANPDLSEEGGNPLIHYIKFGLREGRDPTPALPSSIRDGKQRRQGRPSESRANDVQAPDRYRVQYMSQLDVATGGRDPQYAPTALNSARVSPDDPAILAFYLPQFHPIPENDRWWGKGFTEWTNVSKAAPQFVGHYQPRLPGELGYYDLRLPEVLARQIELAKHYGVSGFCFHYYWFDGHRLLERPIEFLLAQTAEEFDFPFCLCWANENWTCRWDGSENDILIEQNHTPEDHARVFEDLRRFVMDKRYIRVDGKPMIIVYRPAIIPDVEKMAEIWRALAAEAGLPGLYLVATNAFGFDGLEDIGFDAVCQFPPHSVHVGRVDDNTLELLNPAFSGKVYDYGNAVEVNLKMLERIGAEQRHRDYFASVMMGWDNEARKPAKGQVFHGATPQKFRRWLEGAVDWSKMNNAAGRRFVFVNAWNEWAEGSYLEPDRKFGYGYLAAVANIRARGVSNEPALSQLAAQLAAEKKKNAKIFFCIHIFCEASIEECAAAIKTAKAAAPIDVILSIPVFWDEATAMKAVRLLDPVRMVLAGDRGRDVWPFLQAVRIAEGFGYEYGCKLHSEKTEHSPAGDQQPSDLIAALIGRQGAVKAAMAEFAADKRVGLVAPVEAMAPWVHLSANNKREAEAVLSRIGLEGVPPCDFVPGSMFWFRLSAMTKVAELPFNVLDFEPDLDAIDGTLAHSLDRLFPTLVVGNGFKIANCAVNSAGASYRTRLWIRGSHA